MRHPGAGLHSVFRIRFERALGIRRLIAVLIAVLALLLPASPSALGAPTHDGWGFAISDDDWNWDDPGSLPALGDRFARLRPKAFRIQVIWNAADFPWHMDRAHAMIARARSQGVEQIVVTFKKSVGQDVDPVHGSQPSAEGYGEHVAEVVRQLADDVDIWGPANEPNRGETWLPGVPGAQLLAQYYATLQQVVDTWDPTAQITSPDLVDRTDLGTIAAYVNAYENAGGGWGDYIAWHPYWGVHGKTTQTTVDLTNLTPPDTPIWITEAGAFGRSPSGIDEPESVQLDKTWWLANTLAALPRIERVHYYHMRGNPDSGWDTGLLDPDGAPRLAWHVWCGMSHGADFQHPDCQPTPPAPWPPAPTDPGAGSPPPAATAATAPVPAPGPVAAQAADTTAPNVRIARLARRIGYRGFLRGIALRLSTDEASAIRVDLLRKLRDSRSRPLSRLTFAVAAGDRSVTVVPRRKLLGKKRRLTLHVRVTAIDAAGNRRVVVGRVRVTG